MSSCPNCQKTVWKCLGCQKLIQNKEYDVGRQDVAVFCDCCDHNFVCRICYDQHPGYDYWRPVFGNEHSITDKVSNDSSLKRMLQGLFGGQAFTN
jgi:hypothetical protein